MNDHRPTSSGGASLAELEAGNARRESPGGADRPETPGVRARARRCTRGRAIRYAARWKPPASCSSSPIAAAASCSSTRQAGTGRRGRRRALRSMNRRARAEHNTERICRGALRCSLHPWIHRSTMWPQRLAILTGYDEQHPITYLRLLDAGSEGADWQEVAKIVLHIDPAREPDRARRAWESPSRARPLDDGEGLSPSSARRRASLNLVPCRSGNARCQLRYVSAPPLVMCILHRRRRALSNGGDVVHGSRRLAIGERV